MSLPDRPPRVAKSMVFTRRVNQNAKLEGAGAHHRMNKHYHVSAQDNKFLLARGASTGLRAAKRLNVPTSSREENKSCIGLFVTNLNVRTTENQVYKHILLHTGLKVRPEKLPIKYDYCSFLIQCSHQVRTTLSDVDIWPAGSKLKPFLT